MRTWTLDLSYERGPLLGDRMRPPRGTQLREIGLALLGEHSTTDIKHDSDFKPRALWLEPPGPHKAGTLHLVWLSDHWPPPRTPPPPATSGILNWGQGTSAARFTAHPESSSTTTVAALHRHFTDSRDRLRWNECRIRTRSGVLFKRNHTHYVSAALLIDAMINRYGLITSWAPPGHPRPDTTHPIPAAMHQRLTDGCTLTEIRHCAAATPHQIATPPNLTRRNSNTTPVHEIPLQFDLNLRCTDTDPHVLTWFRTLCTVAATASLGRYTPTGLGALTVVSIP